METAQLETFIFSLIEKSVCNEIRTHGWEDRPLRQLELDSLSFAGVVIGIESEFDIELQMEDLDDNLFKLPVRPACGALAAVIQPMISSHAS